MTNIQSVLQFPLMPSLHIDVLGGFTISSDGTQVTVLHAPRLQSLIAYLLLHRDAPVSRQQVASALWPESSEGQSRTNLRKQLLQLRQMLPAIDDFLNDDGNQLQLRKDASLTSDLFVFLRALDQHDYARATSLYRGDLLPACFDEWIQPERERLRRLHLNALSQWAATLEEKRRYTEAVEVAKTLFAMDPLDEQACRRLMRPHALNDNRTEALRAFHVCATALQNELQTQPSAETRELHDRLLQQGLLQITQTALQWPLVGREAEWRQLSKAWNDALMGKPHCVLITGEAGIGKTRLVEELAHWAQRQGIIVAGARCYAAEGSLAYLPVITWLRSPAIQSRLHTLDDSWLVELSRLLPDTRSIRPHLPAPGPLSEGWQRRHLFEVLAIAVHNAGSPLLLIIDDMQWSDRDTLEWLHYLLRHNPRARLLISGTVQREEIDAQHPLHEFELSLKRMQMFAEIELGPLSALETASLAAEVAGHVLPSGVAADLYRETEGNPLFVVESMRSEDGAGAVPSTVQAVIEQRLRRLSPQALETAQLAATIGRAFLLDVMMHASENSHRILTQHLGELLSRDIIREHAGTQPPAYDFSHGQIREVAYKSASLAQRWLMHLRVAEALAHCRADRLDGVSAQIAMHYDLGGRHEQAVHFYEKAAKTARDVSANAEAIVHLRRAQVLLSAQIELGSVPARAQTTHIGETLGDLLLHSTQHAEAQEAYAWALERTGDVLARARLQRKIGNSLRDTRQYEAALAAYNRASETLGEVDGQQHVPAWWHEWIQLQLEIDLVYYWLGDVEANAALLNQLQPILMQHGTATQRASFYQNMTYRRFSANRGVATEDMVESARQALAAYTEAGDTSRLPSSTFGLGFVLLWHGKPHEAEAPLLEALRMAERTSDASLIARCTTYLAFVMREMGRLDEAALYVKRGFEAAENAGMPEYAALAHANATWVAWRKNDWGGMRKHGRTAQEIWAKFPAGHASTVARWSALLPLMALCVRERDLADAVAHAQTLLDPHLQNLPHDLTEQLQHAVTAWHAHHASDALSALKHALQLAERHHLL